MNRPPIALVTGASRGLGREVARRLQRGADSILWLFLHAGPDVTGGFWRDGQRIPW